jgi:hypothetical protein
MKSFEELILKKESEYLNFKPIFPALKHKTKLIQWNTWECDELNESILMLYLMPLEESICSALFYSLQE